MKMVWTIVLAVITIAVGITLEEMSLLDVFSAWIVGVVWGVLVTFGYLVE